jgi:hypothetical protein
VRTLKSRLLADIESNRMKVWNSLRNIDVLSSFIFGKPKSLPMVRQNSGQTHLPVARSTTTSSSAFSAVVQSCSLLEDVVDKLSCGKILHVPTAELLLEQLRTWSQSLPPDLRKISIKADSGALVHATYTVDGSADHDDDVTSQPGYQSRSAHVTGALHVSCIYYFCVMLITRPFLIAYLLSRLKGRAPDQLIPDPTAASDVAIKNSTVSKLAHVCYSAAIHTANTCAAAKKNGHWFGNLGLLQAWVFGAGLVLGFSKFAGEPRKEIDEAFEQVCEILDCMSAQSPQASLYHDILKSFQDSIARWHGRINTEVKRTVQHYMEDILVFDGGRHSDRGRHQMADDPGLDQGTRAREHAGDQTLALDAAAVGDKDDWMEPWSGSTPRSSIQVLRHLGFGDMSIDYGTDDFRYLHGPLY